VERVNIIVQSRATASLQFYSFYCHTWLEDDKTEVELLPIKTGVTVQYQDKIGIVKYIGRVHFQPEVWVGIELPGPDGKNDGSVNGDCYFICKENHGLFVRLEKVELVV